MEHRKILMTLTIDIDQITKALNYDIGLHPDEAEERGILLDEGPYAGTYHFKKWDEVHLKIIAHSRKKDKAQLTITDCTLASVPTMPVESEYLSMFHKHRACTHIADWDIPATHKQTQNKSTVTRISALHPLIVWADKGQWRLSGYLSVLIERMVDGEAKKYSRMFYFDPEGSVGSGGDIDQIGG